MNKNYILGAGGHTRSLLSLISHQNNLNIDGIYDDSYHPENNEVIFDIKVLGTISDLPEIGSLLISYGNLEKRECLFNKYRDRLLSRNLVHPTAIFENKTEIGIANQIFAGTIINAYTNIGDNNIINSGAIIEHEDIIGSHCHISIGTVLGGRVKIGNRVFVGAGATVIDKVSICSDVTIGANSTVLKDITEPGTYVGSPARRVK